MREILFTRVLSMVGPALQKAEKRSGAVLRETGSDHLLAIAEEVSRVAELCIGQHNPPGFVAFGWGLTIKTGAFDSEAAAT
jgi:hypothetical protein